MTKTAAIIGGGVIGGGWAARFLLMGWDVIVFDPGLGAKPALEVVLANAERSLPMLYDVALPERGTLRFADSIAEAVRGVDWVQESVPERLDLKHKVLAEVQAACPKRAIIGSSTSGFKPSELQDGALRPGQIVVAHPFNPVYLLPLVELVASDAVSAEARDAAQKTLTEIGMYPLMVRAEIDAHIADRLLEAVWRESLWLVKDGIATTQEIDDAIRYGFGLRWAQMGLFETYRIAGGEAGMRHFLAQFGPCLEWPWTKLTDVPVYDDALVDLIAGQSDAQSGHLDIRELERLRDNNLVAMMRALRQQGAAAGKLLLEHEALIRPALTEAEGIETQRRIVPVDWTDYNGHMNEGRYGQVFSDAADALLLHVGAGPDYVARGLSFFTVETNINYLAETHAGEGFCVMTKVVLAEGKKLKLHHEMRREDGTVLARCDQFILHVSLETRASCPPEPWLAERLSALV